ncbi:FAD-dependent oxidoreductase [Streptomyces sp. NPDC059909]|uniref:FAD-dependent oxidoreductase n=1 Tax=Streptomyces sp. NPDC059909 TaxID=3346998 RepID=UPI00365F6DE0
MARDMTSVPDGASHGSRWDAEFDVVVVGSGAGGFAAAVTAAAEDASVVVLEKAATTGGTTRKAAAWFWILNNRFMREAGIKDPREDALRLMARMSRPAMYSPDAPHLGIPECEFQALAAFYDNGDDAVTALERLGALDVGSGLDFPDYAAHLEENVPKRGRVLWPAAAGGGQSGGEEMIQRFERAADRLGVQVRTSTPVVDIVVEDGAVTGVVAGGTGGGRIRARQGVVFATGGFTHNARLRREFLRGPYVGGCAAVTNTGDFLPLAQSVGAELANMQHAWSTPIVIERVQRDPRGVAGSFVLPGDGMVLVNRSGVRAVNEKAVYHELTHAFFAWDTRRLQYPNLPLIAIWDEPVATGCAGSDFGNPVPPPGVDGYWVVTADDLPGLAREIDRKLEQLGLPADHDALAPDFDDNLACTLERFRGFAETGVDRDFHRGETPIELALAATFGGDGPNPTLRALNPTGPYYATVLGPGTLDTKGGPRVDVHGRVLRHDGTPVEGLYGVGNCVASPSAEAYWAGGATIGPILCFAHLLGKHVAQRRPVRGGSGRS